MYFQKVKIKREVHLPRHLSSKLHSDLRRPPQCQNQDLHVRPKEGERDESEAGSNAHA